MDADALLEGLDPSQREAVTTEHRPLAIHAGAGSGKTRVLTHRIAWQSATGAIAPGRVLALTFTRKAAAELRDRLARLGVT
jgi:DNA helicase-2/ATP-dependent DNA helicase PcrA